MILIIEICKEKLHHLEFVKPIEDVMNKVNKKFETAHFKELSNDILSKAEKVIICGTSLKDNNFLNSLEKFSWIKKFEKPMLGICGGKHILGLIFEGDLIKQQEIGLTDIKFKEEFLGLKNTKQVYELHNFYAKSKEFDVIATSKNCPQAIKHKQKPFYGVLFHPEVRNKELLINFANL
jgi:GMP synthase (glutamine-hydrolysing)